MRNLVELIAQDYRDVIVAGEYESIGGQLKKVRDLTQSFTGGDT